MGDLPRSSSIVRDVRSRESTSPGGRAQLGASAPRLSLTDAYQGYKATKNWKARLERIPKYFDEETRTEALVESAFDAAKEILGRVLPGASSHPFFAYHRPHFKALAKALQAFENAEQARRLQEQSIALARSVRDRCNEAERKWAVESPAFDDFRWTNSQRYAALTFGRFSWRHHEKHPSFVSSAFSLGWQAWQIGKRRDAAMDEVLEAYAVLELDARCVEAGWRRYQQKLERMRGKKGISAVAAHAVEGEGELAQVTDLGGTDPVSLARGATRRLFDLVGRWAQEADRWDAEVEKLAL